MVSPFLGQVLGAGAEFAASGIVTVSAKAKADAARPHAQPQASKVRAKKFFFIVNDFGDRFDAEYSIGAASATKSGRTAA